MKTILLASGALLLASAVPAFAQDTAGPSTTSGASDSAAFTGPRAELFGGWDRVGTRTRFDDGTTRSTTRSHKDGATFGGLLGYDMPIGDKLTAGVYGSYAISTAKSCAYSDVGGGCVKPGRELEGGARLGYKATPKTLVYLKGAYVNGQVRSTVGSDGDYFHAHANRDGWRAGAGAEYALDKHAYVKVEYDYTRFKSLNADDLGVPDTNVRFDRNQVLAGVGVRF